MQNCEPECFSLVGAENDQGTSTGLGAIQTASRDVQVRQAAGQAGRRVPLQGRGGAGGRTQVSVSNSGEDRRPAFRRARSPSRRAWSVPSATASSSYSWVGRTGEAAS